MQFLAIIISVLGCSSEWSTNQLTTPLTYKVPAYRAERTVGNLMWLAVLPVRRYECGFLGNELRESTTVPEVIYDAATYLSESKGYNVKVVVDATGVSCPDIVVKSEFDSVDDLKTVWENAGTEDEIAAAVRKIGAALHVDGIVSILAEDTAAIYESRSGRLVWRSSRAARPEAIFRNLENAIPAQVVQ